MTSQRRIENIVQLTDTLWQLNRNRRAKEIEKMSGVEMPEDCMKLAEFWYRAGAIDMEKANGRNWRKNV